MTRVRRQRFGQVLFAGLGLAAKLPGKLAGIPRGFPIAQRGELVHNTASMKRLPASKGQALFFWWIPIRRLEPCLTASQ